MLESVPMLQIKEIPEDVHRTLKARAALAGLTLTEHVRQILVDFAGRKSREELIAELRSIPIRRGGESSAEAVRGRAGPVRVTVVDASVVVELIAPESESRRDAALAQRREGPLLTTDVGLGRAARTVGVEVLTLGEE